MKTEHQIKEEARLSTVLSFWHSEQIPLSYSQTGVRVKVQAIRKLT